MTDWNPWHGCHKLSPGCLNCYVYRRDSSVGKDARRVHRTRDFDLPIRRARSGEWKVKPGETIFTCFTSDFFLDEADPWRAEAWRMIRMREDCQFFMVTKRIDRFCEQLPTDWGAGYPHVTIACTCENQDRANYRLPIFLNAPIAHRHIVCEPLLEPIDLEQFLRGDAIERVTVGGESGDAARPCRYEWVLGLRAQCARTGTGFYFKQTGANFVKDERVYQIPRAEQMKQARKANIDLKRRTENVRF